MQHRRAYPEAHKSVFQSNMIIFRLLALPFCLVFISGQAPSQKPTEPVADALPGNQNVIKVLKNEMVELHADQMPLTTVLRLLAFETKRNIIASPNVKGTVTADIYGAKFEDALQAILSSHGAAFRVLGNFTYIYTNEELAKLADTNRPMMTRVIVLNYITAADAKTYVEPLLGKEGTVTTSPPADTGLTTESTKTGGASSASQDFLIVTAHQEHLAEVERILKELDVRPKQVLVEATILRADLDDDNALGIDFTVVGGVDLEELGSTSTGITGLVTGALPQGRFERFNSNTSTDFRGDVPQGGLQFGVIKDHVGVFLRALEQVTDTTVLANPKVLTLNKQKGYVIVGRRDGYLTTTVTETQAIQAVEFLETGTRLVFRPYIGVDGFIRVELHPEDSVGFVNAQGLPSKQTTEVTTNILVRDGETILIGGLFREVTTSAKKQIPGLGNVPGLGGLFRSKSDKTEREEVIILLTLHVVKDHAAYADVSKEQLEDMERLRLGARRGLMVTGRDRLAQRHYHKAVEAHTQGNDDKALWHLKLAQHTDPRLLAAVRLQETIVHERTWGDSGGAGGRGFIHRLISKGTSDPNPMFETPQSNHQKIDHTEPHERHE
ncbi:MAG: hypothetical protein AABZ47_06485 [Planctomycetota bacterium]